MGKTRSVAPNSLTTRGTRRFNRDGEIMVESVEVFLDGEKIGSIHGAHKRLLACSIVPGVGDKHYSTMKACKNFLLKAYIDEYMSRFAHKSKPKITDLPLPGVVEHLEEQLAKAVICD